MEKRPVTQSRAGEQGAVEQPHLDKEIERAIEECALKCAVTSELRW